MLTGRDRPILSEVARDQHLDQRRSKEVVYHIGRTDRDVRRLLFRSLAFEKHRAYRDPQQKAQYPDDDVIDVLTVISRVPAHRPIGLTPYSPFQRKDFGKWRPGCHHGKYPLEDAAFYITISLLLTFCPAPHGAALDGYTGDLAVCYHLATDIITRYCRAGDDITYEIFEKASLAMEHLGRVSVLGPAADFIIWKGFEKVTLKRDLLGYLSRIFENFVGPTTVPFYCG